MDISAKAQRILNKLDKNSLGNRVKWAVACCLSENKYLLIGAPPDDMYVATLEVNV